MSKPNLESFFLNSIIIKMLKFRLKNKVKNYWVKIKNRILKNLQEVYKTKKLLKAKANSKNL
jgi:hypothetical protein